VPVILLADSGFGRTELASTGQALGSRCLIRLRPDVWVERPCFKGKPLD
jgi:hypothetical protein